VSRDAVNPGAARAFRRYAMYGFHKRRMKVFEAYASIRGIMPDETRALDMLTVFDTLRLLSASGQSECVRAVRDIYFANRGRAMKKNELTLRVRRHAIENYCDERTVWRRLLRARELYTVLRAKTEL